MSFSSQVKDELSKKAKARKHGTNKGMDSKRALIRDAFIASGSINNPKRSYHFEIVCQSRAKAERLRDAMADFDLEAKIVERKKSFVVYLKEGSQIVDVLNVMEAHAALLNLENVRIFKEVRNSVNRKVNCEAANIHKTVSAALEQIEDIHCIERNIGLGSLSDNLQEIARLRVEYPEASLKELGSLLHPPIGKSGVNHRLRKLNEMAVEIRGKKE